MAALTGEMNLEGVNRLRNYAIALSADELLRDSPRYVEGKQRHFVDGIERHKYDRCWYSIL